MGTRDTPGQQSLNSVQTYFNGQPDFLTAIVKHRTSTKGHLGDLYIQDFDPSGHYVTLITRPPPKGEDVELRIPFNPPIANIFEVKPRLYYWRDEANRHFKVPLRPTIGYYKPPSLIPYTLPAIIGLSVLFFAIFGWGYYADILRLEIQRFAGPYALHTGVAVAALFHLVVEPIYMIWATEKHNVPLDARIKWVLTTAAIGFGALNEFWECIQLERIRHIYAQTDVGPLPPVVPPKISKIKKDA